MFGYFLGSVQKTDYTHEKLVLEMQVEAMSDKFLFFKFLNKLDEE